MIETKLDQLKTIPADLMAAGYSFVGKLRDFGVKLVQDRFPSLKALVHGSDVRQEDNKLIGEVQCDPLPALPSRIATEHLVSGKTKQVSISGTQEVNVHKILAEGRPTVVPTAKNALLIGIGSQIPVSGSYLSVAGVSVGGVRIPAQNMIVRKRSKAVPPNPYIDQAVEKIDARFGPDVAEAFAKVTEAA